MTLIYPAIILAMLLGRFLLDLAADLFNLKTLAVPPPGEFSDLYDTAAYKKSQAYTAVNTRFRVIVSTFELALLLLFWSLGGFAALDLYLRNLALPFLVTGLLYIGVLVFANHLLSIPASLYRTFVIEESFGFNKTTRRTYLTDQLKNLLLAVLIGGPVLGAVLWLFQYGGPDAWFWAWLVAALASIIITFIAPRLILPLFLKFTPLAEGELKNQLVALAKKLKFPINGIYLIDGSRRSTKANAFFTGFGKNKRIALFDTLVAKHKVPEIVAVLGHEIGHYKKRHQLFGLGISLAGLGLLFFFFSRFLGQPVWFGAFGVVTPAVYTGLVFFGFLSSLAVRLWSVLTKIVSRAFEYQADRFAAAALHRPEDLIAGLKKLTRDNLGHLTPHPFCVFINYSHPPLTARVRALKEFSRQPSSTFY